MKVFKILIDGVVKRMKFERFNKARGFQYHVLNDNDQPVSSHGFKNRIDSFESGTRFRTNGHDYEIL